MYSFCLHRHLTETMQTMVPFFEQRTSFSLNKIDIKKHSFVQIIINMKKLINFFEKKMFFFQFNGKKLFFFSQHETNKQLIERTRE